jgi:hypothetical protein
MHIGTITVPGTVIRIRLFSKDLQNIACRLISKLYRVQFLLGLNFCGCLLTLRGEKSARDWTCEDAEDLTLQNELENAAHGGSAVKNRLNWELCRYQWRCRGALVLS